MRLDAAAGAHELVPGSRYDRRPSYYIYGGLVLCPLTLDYLRTWGETWATDAPTQLLNYYVNGRASEPEEEVVLIIKVLTRGPQYGLRCLCESAHRGRQRPEDSELTRAGEGSRAAGL